jgi:hypothetical protein
VSPIIPVSSNGQHDSWVTKILIVFVKRRVTVVLPDKDVELGELGSVDDIRIFSEMTPQGLAWNAVKTPTKVASEAC